MFFFHSTLIKTYILLHIYCYLRNVSKFYHYFLTFGNHWKLSIPKRFYFCMFCVSLTFFSLVECSNGWSDHRCNTCKLYFVFFRRHKSRASFMCFSFIRPCVKHTYFCTRAATLCGQATLFDLSLFSYFCKPVKIIDLTRSHIR